MEQPDKLSRSAFRYLDGGSRCSLERLTDLCAQALSKALYDRLGVRLVKQYTPTAGDIVNCRYGLTIADIHPTLDSLIRFEQMTRVWVPRPAATIQPPTLLRGDPPHGEAAGKRAHRDANG